MLTVEQVRNLDGKVRQALELIEKLKTENSMLKGRLDEYKNRVEQLESVVDGFKLEQLEIEEGIKEVLSQLDQLEDQITAPPSSEPEVPVVTPSPEELSAAGFNSSPDTAKVSEAPAAPAEDLNAQDLFDKEPESPEPQIEPVRQGPELEIF